MTAGLFVQHGVWAGTDNISPTKWNEKGTFENWALKRLLISQFGRLVNKGQECPKPHPDFADKAYSTIERCGYQGGRWLFKVSVVYWRAFEGLSPIWVTVRRPTKSITESNRRAGTLNVKNIESSVARHMDLLDERERAGALRIDSPRLIERDYSQIREVFEKCGLEFSESIADRWVSPRLWHC